MHYHHSPSSNTGKVLLLVLLLNLLLLIVEVIAGFWTGSLALLSDAAHMVSDVAALSIALMAAHFANKPSTLTRSFGFSSAEALGAFANATALLVACILIFSEAVHRLVVGVPDVVGLPVLIVGVVGLLVNLGSVWFLHRGDSHNLNIRGAIAHMMADALGSVGAIAAALCMMLGYSIADPIISILIGLIILANAYGLLKDCIRVLMGFSPSHIDPAEVINTIKEQEEVIDVRDLHIWTLDGRFPLLTVHIYTGTNNCNILLFKIKEILKSKYNIEHSTIQIEHLHEEVLS